MPWYFYMESEEHGSEAFGPYATQDEAWDGLRRVATEAQELEDGIERWFQTPHQSSGDRMVDDLNWAAMEARQSLDKLERFVAEMRDRHDAE